MPLVIDQRGLLGIRNKEAKDSFSHAHCSKCGQSMLCLGRRLTVVVHKCHAWGTSVTVGKQFDYHILNFPAL